MSFSGIACPRNQKKTPLFQQDSGFFDSRASSAATRRGRIVEAPGRKLWRGNGGRSQMFSDTGREPLRAGDWAALARAPSIPDRPNPVVALGGPSVRRASFAEGPPLARARERCARPAASPRPSAPGTIIRSRVSPSGLCSPGDPPRRRPPLPLPPPVSPTGRGAAQRCAVTRRQGESP